VLKPADVEEVLRRLTQGEKVLVLARESGIDPRTIRAWHVAERLLRPPLR